MNAKNIIIALSVVLLIGTGIFLYQKDKQKQELHAYNIKKFEQATLAAKKSSVGGVLLMASTLKKYHQIKGEYPPSLDSLYPDLIPHKPFINDINWHYTHEKDSFNIEHSIKNSNYVSSMGPDMKLTNRILGRDTQHEKVAKTEPQKPRPTPIEQIRKVPTILTEPARAISAFVKNSSPAPESDSNIRSESQKPAPEIKIVETKLNKRETFLNFISTRNLYIWKNKDNVIGFSNIQYPDDKDIRIYRDKKWIEYQSTAEKKPSKKIKTLKAKGDV